MVKLQLNELPGERICSEESKLRPNTLEEIVCFTRTKWQASAADNFCRAVLRADRQYSAASSQTASINADQAATTP